MLNWWSTHSISLPLSAALSALLGIFGVLNFHSGTNTFIWSGRHFQEQPGVQCSLQKYSQGEVTADGHAVMSKMFISLSYIRTFIREQCANVLI